VTPRIHRESTDDHEAHVRGGQSVEQLAEAQLRGHRRAAPRNVERNSLRASPSARFTAGERRPCSRKRRRRTSSFSRHGSAAAAAGVLDGRDGLTPLNSTSSGGALGVGKSRCARATGAIREALGHLGTIKIVGPEGIELAVDLRKADEGTITGDLSQLFLQLGGAAANKSSGVVFLLDEVQFVREVEYRAVVSALHRATQRSMPITLAAGHPQIARLTGEARSLAALVEPARRQGVGYSEDAVELALSWTGGYPFYIQQFGKHAWSLAARSPIATADVEAAMPAAQAALDSSILPDPAGPGTGAVQMGHACSF
jgi:hypothetical protein